MYQHETLTYVIRDMSKCDIINSVNKFTWLFREYGTLNVTEVFLFDGSVFF